MFFGFISISICNGGQTVSWSSAVPTGIYDSSGAIFPDVWTVALGTFGDNTAGDFDPQDWAANWVELDTAVYDVNPFPAFQSSVTISDIDRANEQLYMWFYNNQVGDITSEWALVSDSGWTIASEADLQQGQGTEPISIVLQDAGIVEWGRSDTIVGDGVQISTPPPGFDLQTHTFPPPVPEPSVVVILLLAMCPLGVRRSRNP